MNKKKWYWQGVALLACGALLTACSPAQAVGSGKTGDTQTTTTLQPTSSTVSSTIHTTTQPTDVTTTTAKKKTTTTKNKTTTTAATQPSKAVASSYTKPATDDSLTFSYESEDYDVLRRFIMKEFPEEKALDEFHITKKKYSDETTSGVPFDATFKVEFTRYINGCVTEIHYTLFFDEQERFLGFRYRNPVYDATKVKAPRVATEQEIEQAKKEAAEKLKDGNVIWEQQVSKTIYLVASDKNCIRVETIYAPEAIVEQFGYLDPNNSNYGKTPPHSMYTYVFTINR